MYFCKDFYAFKISACVFLLIDIGLYNGDISKNIINVNISHYNINFKPKSPRSQAPSLLFTQLFRL
jgi:hypothetical protein